MFSHSERAVYPVLLISVLIIAGCGILYELLLSSVSSYFLGNSILHFSLTIGLFMFFMGVGSYLSKFIRKNLFDAFITIEIILGFFGGISTIILYLSYAYTRFYHLYNFFFIALLGVLIGLEIPIVARIINKYSSLKETVAKVFSFDYMGALAASLLFPLVLLPWFGVIKTAQIIGLINLFIAFYNAFFFRKLLNHGLLQTIVSGGIMVLFGVGMFYAPLIDNKLEQKVYQDQIIMSKQTKYQKLVLTRWNEDYRLYINGAIQFSSYDEYRYHESLVHMPMMLAASNENILILGGGDGMVLREVLKYPGVKKVDLVDLDPEMTKLGTENPILRKLNQDSMHDQRLQVFNQDAYNFIKESSDIYSVIIIDLPDPNSTGLGKLYTKEFYGMLSGRLDAGGVLVTQSTSPYFAPKAFWCIYHTITGVFGKAIPYQTNVPSFGIWGFVMAGGGLNKVFTGNESHQERLNYLTGQVNRKAEAIPALAELKYFSTDKIPAMLYFEKDIAEIPTEVNRLSTQKLVEYYSKSAENWRY